MKRFRSRLVSTAHRLLHHSTSGWRVIQKKRRRAKWFHVGTRQNLSRFMLFGALAFCSKKRISFTLTVLTLKTLDGFLSEQQTLHAPDLMLPNPGLSPPFLSPKTKLSYGIRTLKCCIVQQVTPTNRYWTRHAAERGYDPNKYCASPSSTSETMQVAILQKSHHRTRHLISSWLSIDLWQICMGLGAISGLKPTLKRFDLRILVYLVMYDSG